MYGERDGGAAEDGALVAWVPPRASGFTVHAPGLTAWDLGTIFSVSAKGRKGQIFVFKGGVQVTDETGDGIALCEAGEGVLAEENRLAVKVSSDWPQAWALFRQVSGRKAAEEPEQALAVAEKVGRLWIARYAPEEAARVLEREERLAALRNAPKKVPFSKAAWVRSVGVRRATGGTKEENMKTTSAAAVLTAAAMTMGTQLAGARSDPVLVRTSSGENRYWETVYTNEVDVSWRWPSDATTARLTVTGMSGTAALETNVTTSVSNVLWRAFASGTPDAEDTYELRLTFYEDGASVVGVQTSRLAVVKGAFGAVRVDPAPAGVTWSKVKENAVISYDAAWTEATADAAESRLVIAKVGGMTQTNAFAETGGYFGWKIKQSFWGYGTFNLALSFPDTVTNVWDATLVRVPDGMMIKVQ